MEQIDLQVDLLLGIVYSQEGGVKCGDTAKNLYDKGWRKRNDVIDEFVKRLLDAFPEADRNNHCPAIYYDDYSNIIEELAEKMKGE